MTTREIQIQRFSVVSAKAFEDVLDKLDAAIGHPEMKMFLAEIVAARTYPEIEQSSRPGESHPQALTDPDMNVSAHPALTVLVVARCSSGQ